jgi:hypothetical protein
MENRLLSQKVIILRLLEEKLENIASYENFELQIFKYIMTIGIESLRVQGFVIFLGFEISETKSVKYAICTTICEFVRQVKRVAYLSSIISISTFCLEIAANRYIKCLKMNSGP